MTIQMERRMLYIPVLHIDTNLVNARQKLDSVNQLEKWADDGVILINMSATAHQEAQYGKNSGRVQKANQQIYTATPSPEASDPKYKLIETALFPNGASNNNEQNDVKIVYEAARYAAILVTSVEAQKDNRVEFLEIAINLKI